MNLNVGILNKHVTADMIFKLYLETQQSID